MADHDADNPPHKLSPATSNQGYKPIASDDATRDMEMGSHQNSSPSLVPVKQEKDHATPGSEPRTVHHYDIPSTAWAFEIFAITLSSVAFTAIVVVLRIYQNRPQEAWPYNHLTLNGLIAFLSTISQGSLFVAVGAAISQAKWTWFTPSTHKPFKGRPIDNLATIDEASRSMLGSLKLLWMTKGYHLAAIGALLSLMALAFDTFVQQVLTVSFQNAIIMNSQQAYFPRCEYYPVGKDISLSSIASTNLAYTASVDMQAAIASGLLAATVDDLAATCSTGNCTWPIIPTIAVCGACTNITEKLKTTCDDSLGMCAHKLPSGLDLTVEYNDEFGPGSGNVVYFTSAPTSDGTYKSGNIGAGTNQPDEEKISANPMYLANFQAINLPYFGGNGNYTQMPTATQCALWFCMQAFNASVVSGRQTQNVRETWTKLDWLPDANNGAGIHQFVDIPESFNVAPSSNFTIDKMALIALQQSFNLSQSIKVGGYGNADTGYVSSPSAEGLWYGSQDWDAWIARLAKSVSNDLRSYYSANLSTAPAYAGTTYALKSFISVRWQWLAYPASMLVMGLLFFVATIWESHDRGVPAWKDGPLTLLAARLDDDVLKQGRIAIDEPDGVAKAYGSRRVMLENNEGLLTFLQVQSV